MQYPTTALTLADLIAENAELRAENERLTAELRQHLEGDVWRDTAISTAQELLPKWRDGFTPDADDLVAIKRILAGPDETED